MSDLPVIQDKRKVDVPTLEGEMVLEANWSPEVTPCKRLRVTISGINVEVETEKLIATLMFFANNQQMEKLVSKNHIEMKEYETMLEVVTIKNLLKGEKIMLPVSIKIPKEGEQPIISTLTTKY
jgi:hypothetical protein